MGRKRNLVTDKLCNIKKIIGPYYNVQQSIFLLFGKGEEKRAKPKNKTWAVNNEGQVYACIEFVFDNMHA